MLHPNAMILFFGKFYRTKKTEKENSELVHSFICTWTKLPLWRDDTQTMITCRRNISSHVTWVRH